MCKEAVALCTLLLLACASAVAPVKAHETDAQSRSLLQLYTEQELQQEVELVKQHIANLQEQLLANKGATTGMPLDNATEATESNQDAGSALATATQASPAEADIFTFDLTQDQQAPPVELSQRRAGLLRILSRIAETDPHLFYKPAPLSANDSTSSDSSSDSYLPESAQLLGPGYLQMTAADLFRDADSSDQVEAQLKTLLTKLNGRGPKIGVKESQFAPRTESAVLAPLVEQSGSDTRDHGNSMGGKLPGDAVTDASTANAQLVSLLSRVNGISGSIMKTAAEKEFKPRSEAVELSGTGEFVETDADAAGELSSGSSIEEGLQRDAATGVATQDTSMSGKGPYYGSTSAVSASGSVQLADPNEIHAEPALRVRVLDPVTLAAPPAEEAMSYQDIQKTAADVAAAAAAAGKSSKSRSSSTSSGSSSVGSADSDGTTVIIPVNPATDAADGPPHANVQTPGKQALSTGAVTGIAISAFIAVLSGAGALLMWQARQIRKEVDSGYTKTAHNEDVESVSKPPAICVSPAVSMGGAIPSAGGALPSTGGAANWQELSARSTTGGVQDTFAPVCSGTGYLRAVHVSGAHSFAAASTISSAAASAHGTKPTASGSVYTLEEF